MAPPSRGPSSAPLLGWDIGVAAQGGGSATSLLLAVRVRADFFPVSRALPTFLCPFAGCSRLADPDPLPSGQVKTGTVLAFDDSNKSLHITVCSSATLHSQP